MGIEEEKLLEAVDFHNALGQQSRALSEVAASHKLVSHTAQALQRDFGVSQMLSAIGLNESLTHSALRSLANLPQAAFFNETSLASAQFELALRAIADWEKHFRLPAVAETSRLFAEFQTSAASEALKRYTEDTFGIHRAMESMRVPWLNIHESIRSIASFSSLNAMGSALSHMPAFGDHLDAALRVDLGDWRDTITWPKAIFTDFAVRSDFYTGLGFDPTLTDFPAPAFGQILEIANLRREPPPLVELYGSPVPISDDIEEEAGLLRTNVAHDWLLRFETNLRLFIDEQMTTAFGQNWPKQRLPNGLYDEWQEKKRAAMQHGACERPLVAYADFSDYMQIICKRDNWPIFAPFFARRENVRESFQRLHPIRLDTMHARPITTDDELLLYVETRRWTNMITSRQQ